jgi:disulfide bond formation protein DsbB
MSETKRVVTLTAPAMNGLFLCAMLLALAIVLTTAMVLQFGFGEIPCPLCLLQRFAMFGCCFGLIKQLHSDSESGTGISLIFSILC